MPAAITLKITDTASAAVAKLQEAGQRTRPLMAAVGKRVVITLRQHLQSRQKEGNKKGWSSKGFWYGATTQSVSQNIGVSEIAETKAVVAISDARFAHKVRGGEIRPKRGRYLAIPLNEAAYWAGSPREGNIPDLFAITLHGKKWLAQKKVGNGLTFFYRLMEKVTQPADPNALPAAGVLEGAINDEGAKYFARIMRRLQGGAE